MWSDLSCAEQVNSFSTRHPSTHQYSQNKVRPEFRSRLLLTLPVVAFGEMGDLSHMIKQVQYVDVGNNPKNGIFSRKNTNCALTIVSKSSCRANDTLCDNGSSIAVHISYVQVYGKQATNFIAGRANRRIAINLSGNGSFSGTKPKNAATSFRWV